MSKPQPFRMMESMEVILNAIDSMPVGTTVLIQGNLTTTGSTQQLPDTSCKVVTIQANPDNADNVYIGLAGCDQDSHMAVLSPGSAMTFTIGNINLLYANAVAGNKISWGGEA